MTPLQRVFEIVQCKTQMELADYLGIRQSSISDAKRRNSVPAEWLIKLLRMKGINPDWVLSGQGPRYMQPVLETEGDFPPVVYRVEIRPPEDCTTQELFTELVRRSAGEAGVALATMHHNEAHHPQ